MKPREAISSDSSDRRRWLAGAARYGLLGGLAILSGHLLFGPQRPDCARSIPCQQCKAWGTCRLPTALAARRRMEG